MIHSMGPPPVLHFEHAHVFVLGVILRVAVDLPLPVCNGQMPIRSLPFLLRVRPRASARRSTLTSLANRASWGTRATSYRYRADVCRKTVEADLGTPSTEPRHCPRDVPAI